MYNGHIINQLLSDRNIKKKDFMQAVGWNSGTQYRQAVTGNPTAATLEKIADFFSVPIDLFFERENPYYEHCNVVGHGNNVQNFNSVIYNEQKEKDRIDALTKLIEEKDNHINTLQKMIELLEHSIGQRLQQDKK